MEVHAHRGGALCDGVAVHAEQTLPALARTWAEHGVVCELDVRFTGDGVPVVFHDPDLKRMVGIEGRIDELDIATFLALRTDLLGADRRLAVTADPVPLLTLQAALRHARRRGACLNVELKNLPGEPAFDPTERTAERLAHALGRSRIPAHRLTVQTFWAPDALVFSRQLPGVRRSLLVEAGDEADGLRRALMAGVHAVGLAWPVAAETVQLAHARGLEVMTYTVNDPGAVLAARRAGIDVVITDDPAMALRTLAAPRERLPAAA
jgi:glycerophosphoryl diester phosphodiesterase